MSLQLHGRNEHGVAIAKTPARTDADWRRALRSPRWNAAPLANPEMNPTSRVRSVATWLALGVVTFGSVLLGYGTGFWR